MANETQDFNIKVVTTADTTGIKQTSAELDKLKQQQATWAATQARIQAQPPPVAPIGGGPSGFAGATAGLATIAYLLTGAIKKYQEFEEEQDRASEARMKATEKSRELGLAVVDMLDAMKSAERIDTEPLQVSFDRLKQKVGELKTEMKLAFDVGDYEAVKKYASALGVVESQLRGVTSAMERQTAAADKLAEKNREAAASFLKGAVETSSPQTQAVLKNEEAARKAREAGDQKSADQYQKSADQLKASMSQAQREEYEGFTKTTRLGPKALPGESQEAIDEIARNKINFDRQLKGEPPLPPQSAAGGAGGNADIIQAMYEIWGR